MFAENRLKEHFQSMRHKIKNIGETNNKLVVTLDSDTYLSKSQCYLGHDMFISQDRHNSNKYSIKKLSKTNNASVVFSLKYIGEPDSSKGLNVLKDEIKKYM